MSKPGDVWNFRGVNLWAIEIRTSQRRWLSNNGEGSIALYASRSGAEDFAGRLRGHLQQASCAVVPVVLSGTVFRSEAARKRAERDSAAPALRAVQRPVREAT